MTSLADAVAGRLAGWQGLTGRLGEAELRAELGGDFTRDPVPRPRGARGYTVLHGARTTPPEEIDVWFPLHTEEAALVEFRPPPELDHDGVLADLGEPELVLDSNHFEAGAVVRDQVHAARGITVTVAEPFEPGPTRVAYVQLYAPTTTQAYVTELGQSGEALRPYPRSD